MKYLRDQAVSLTPYVSQSSEDNLIDTDADPGEDLIGPLSADAMDADTFEVLAQGNIHSAATIPDQHDGDATTGVFESPLEQAIPFDIPNAEMSLTVVIDHFLLGSVGAPIPGVPQGLPAHESIQATAVESAWAPFDLECDWKFAHWAKTCGPTSSAVTDLLAIGEVYTLFKSIILSLIRL